MERESVTLNTVWGGGESWGLGARRSAPSGKEQSKSGELSEWAAEHTRASDLNWKVNHVRFTRFEDRPLR